MKKKVLWVGCVLLLIMVSLSVYLYIFGGYKQYLRSQQVIGQMSNDDQKYARDVLDGTDARQVERGIVAGTWLGRVWVWRLGKLVSYTVDDFTVYSHFNGCSEEIRAKLKRGESNTIVRSVYDNIGEWSDQVTPGDYIAIFKAQEKDGFIVGNVREIFNYNFWLFMNEGIDKQCAK